jgi:ribonuclease VapC
MVVDSSALVAIVLEEKRAVEFLTKMTHAFSLKISAVTLAESSMVLLSRGGQVKVDLLDVLIQRFGFEIVSVDRTQASIALDAFRFYGKGRNKASLNFGDCFSYALAKYCGEPLLFQGNDFGQTDVAVA